MKILITTANLLLMVCLGGCATLFAEKRDTVSFSSDLNGVKAYIDGEYAGELPLEITLDREVFKQKTITFKKDGYKTYETRVKKTLEKIALLNFTFWPSWITDAFSGAMIEYSPKKYMIELEPENNNQAQRQEFETKRFVGMSFQPLLRDISRDQREYLDTLVAMLADSRHLQLELNAYINRNRTYLAASPTPMDLYSRLRVAMPEFNG